MLDLPKDFRSQERRARDSSQYRRDSIFGTEIGYPKLQLSAHGSQFEGEDGEPVEHEHPADGESPVFAEEAVRVIIEGSRDRKRSWRMLTNGLVA